MQNGLRIQARRAPWSASIEFLIYEVVGGVHKSIATNLVMRALDITDQGVQIEPTYKLSFDESQVLIDELWDCGIRPTSGAGSVGQLAATQAHLEDMRKLVFDKK